MKKYRLFDHCSDPYTLTIVTKLYDKVQSKFYQQALESIKDYYQCELNPNYDSGMGMIVWE